MAWTIRYNGEREIIELTYSGQVSPAELKEALDATVSLAHEKGTENFFADCTDMIGGHSIVDLYFLISLFEETGLSKIKEALLLPSLESTKEEVLFYETACLNRGFDVKVFNDPQAALDWLTA